MVEVETLHSNEWVSLKVLRAAELGVGGYVFSQETRCQGRIVAVLPYRFVEVVGRGGSGDSSSSLEFLVKVEMTPCWSLEQVPSSITGGYEGDDIAMDAVRELLEETGYQIVRDELIPLGMSYASKSSDTLYTLFGVDLTGREPGEAVGDGSRLESESAAVWVPGRDLAGLLDPQLHVMYVRLLWLLSRGARVGEMAAGGG